MIWGKAIVLFLTAVLAMDKEKGGMMEKKGGMDKEKGDWDKEDMKKPMDRREMNKEHDSIDLCMFTVDDEQCGKVDGCQVVSKVEYMQRKMEIFGMDDDDKQGSGSGRGRMGG